MNPTLAAITLPPWGQAIAIALFVMISLLMIGVILLQRPQGGGLTAAFGGSQGAGQTAFGTKTGDALTIFTCVVFAVYVGASVFLNHAMKPQSAAAAVTPAPVTPATTPATTPSAAVNPAAAPTLTPIADPTKNPPTTPVTTPSTSPATTPPTTPPATNPELPKNPEPKTPEPAPTTPPGQPK